jgi:hypothetical protein
MNDAEHDCRTGGVHAGFMSEKWYVPGVAAQSPATTWPVEEMVYAAAFA